MNERKGRAVSYIHLFYHNYIRDYVINYSVIGKSKVRKPAKIGHWGKSSRAGNKKSG